MSKNICSQMMREIEEVKSVELFRAYHDAVHMEARHVMIDDNGLIRRLFKFPLVPDELIISSRFTIPMQEILDTVYSCIMASLKEVDNWDISRCDLAFTFPVGKVIGHGFIQRTDTTHPFDMSAIRVILSEPIKRGRLFCIKTAYPAPDMDEVDLVWDAKEAYEEKLFSRPQIRKGA